MGDRGGPPISPSRGGFAPGSPGKLRNEVRYNAQMPQAPPKLPAGDDATKAVWWERDLRTITLPRNIVERLRSVHLAQLDELTRLRIEVAQVRSAPYTLNLVREKLDAAWKKDSELKNQAGDAKLDIGKFVKSISDLRYELADEQSQLRTLEAREVQLEERFRKRALRAADSELGAVMQLELTIVGISLDELRELELVRLVTRPLRDAAKQCLGLERAESSACLAETRNRLAIHLRLPPELRASPEHFRSFKKRFVEAKKKGELRVRLEESLVDLEQEFGARVNVQSVSQPILLDGARIIVPQGAGALGMVPEGHPPGLVTLWQVQPGGWASKMSIQSGDTLLWLNEQPVTEIDVNLLAERIRSRRPLTMYVVHPPGPATIKARAEAAARRIQIAFRKKLLRDKAREERRRMKLASIHWEKEERAKATLEARRVAAQASRVDQRALELAENRERMAAALEKEQKEKEIEDRRAALRREYQNNLPEGDAERRAERERLRQEQAAVTLQAGWRGKSARADVQYLRNGKQAAQQLQQVEGMDDLLADLGDYMDLQLVKWEVAVNEKKIGLKTAGMPPDDAVYVSEVTPGGFAAHNGIRVGDQLLQVGGTPLTSMSASMFFKKLKERPCILELGRPEEDEKAAGDDDQHAAQNAAATKLQAGWRGKKGREAANMKRQEIAQDQRLQEQRMADDVVAAARSQEARSVRDKTTDDSGRWIEVTVDPTTMNMGWTPEGMAPNPMVVSAVAARTWAYRQDIRIGDELVAISGKDVAGMDSKTCKKALKQRPVQLLFFRDESQLLKAVAEEGIPRLGWVPDNTDPPQPILVASIEPESWASRWGLAVGDELIEIDRHHVPKMTSVDLQKFLKKRPITLMFKREGGIGYEILGGEFTIVAKEEDKKLGFVPDSMPPEQVTVGVVEDGGWAALHGVEEYDILVAINGGRVDTMKTKDFINTMKKRPLQLTFRHPNEAEHVSGTSGKVKPKAGDRGAGFANAPRGQDSLFELVADKGVGKELGLTPSAMPPALVYVHTIEPGSWAEQHGVAINDQLLEIGGHKVTELSAREFGQLMGSRPLTLLFKRGDGGPELSEWPGDSPDVAKPRKQDKKKRKEEEEEEVEDKKEQKKEKKVKKDKKAKEDKELAEEAPAEEDDGGGWGLGGLFGTSGADAPEAPEEEPEEKEKKEKKDKKGKKEKKKKEEAEEPTEDDWAGQEEAAPSETAGKHGQTWDLVAYEEDEYLGFAPSAMPPDPVFVDSVEPDTWAAWNEIEVNDEIITVNDVAVADMDKKEMKKAMKQRPLYITILREGAEGGGGGGGEFDLPDLGEEEQDEELKKKKKKDKKDKKEKKEKKEEDAGGWGLWGGGAGGDASADTPAGERISGTAQEDDDELGFGIEGAPPDPVEINHIEDYGWAEQAGFQVGDMIVAVNGEEVTNLTKKDMKKAMKERPLKLTVERNR